MPYNAPGKIAELNEALLASWNEWLSAIFSRQIGYAREEEVPSSGEAWLFDPIAAGIDSTVEATISWTAFPKRIADESPTIVQAWRRADDNRNNQEEYCEWEV